MSDMNESLDQRAMSALERAKNSTEKTKLEQHIGTHDESQDVGQHPTISTYSGTQQAPVAVPSITESRSATQGDDEDEAIIFTGSDETTAPMTEDDESVILTNTAKDQMKNMPETEQNAFIEKLMPEIAAYKKKLIIEQGMTPAEATQAANNRMKSKATEANKNYNEEHPDGVIITIDKSQEDNLELTDDDKKKLQVSKALKLVVVETQELETLKIKGKPGKIEMSQIRDICGSLSHYSVPLLEYGDYATFTGAQTGALANATAAEDDDFLDIIEKKASLLYRYFDRATYMSRFGKDGHLMTFEEFCNWYCYDDIDLGLYAIVTASSMETTESSYVCQNDECHKIFNIEYNNKTLLDLSEIPESFRTRVEDIDVARSSTEKMQALHEKYAMHTRVKSPKSGNIYEMGSPTIADVRNRLAKCMDQINGSNAMDMILLLYVDRFFVYDKSDDSYVEVDVREDPSNAFEILTRLHQIDLDLVTYWIQNNKYRPQFKIKTKCPHCGREATDPLSIDSMIFLHARASTVEIM